MSKGKSEVKAVLHWVDTEKVSIEDIRMINKEEDRYIDSKTVATVGSKPYKVHIRLISRGTNELSECEEKVAQEIDARLKARAQVENADKKGRGRRKRRAGTPSKALSRDVALAIGEKLKHSPALKGGTRSAEEKERSRNLKSAMEAVQHELDRDLINEAALPVKRDLFNANKPAVSDVEMESNEDDEADETDEGSVGCDEAIDVTEKAAEKGKDIQTDENSDALGSSGCCQHCRDLLKAGKGKASDFFDKVNNYFSSNQKDEVQYVEVLPIPKDKPRCELSLGSEVYITVADKNSIKVNGGGDPSKIIRLGLIALYGRENLGEQLTAKGFKKGSKTIRDIVRKALLAFANRNAGPTYKKLKESEFNSILNRKKSQVNRSIAKTPSSGTSKSTTKLPSPGSRGLSRKRSSRKKDSPTPKESPVKKMRQDEVVSGPSPVKSHPQESRSSPVISGSRSHAQALGEATSKTLPANRATAAHAVTTATSAEVYSSPVKRSAPHQTANVHATSPWTVSSCNQQFAQPQANAWHHQQQYYQPAQYPSSSFCQPPHRAPYYQYGYGGSYGHDQLFLNPVSLGPDSSPSHSNVSGDFSLTNLDNIMNKNS